MPLAVALDLRAHLDPADLAAPRAINGVFGFVFLRIPANRPDECLLALLSILRMDPPDPILVPLVPSLGRQAMDLQVLGRAPVAKATREETLAPAPLADLLHAREFRLTVAQAPLDLDAVRRLDRRDEDAANAGCRRIVRHRRAAA